MLIKISLTKSEMQETGLDEDDLKEAIKDLVDSGIYFSEIDVELDIPDTPKQYHRAAPAAFFLS